MSILLFSVLSFLALVQSQATVDTASGAINGQYTSKFEKRKQIILKPKQSITFSNIVPSNEFLGNMVQRILNATEDTHNNTTPNIEIWISSLDNEAYDFLSKFAFYYNHIAANVSFTPHYTVEKCESVGNCTTDCLSNQFSCAIGRVEPEVKGRDVLFENLRQKCLFNKSKELWWNYTESYHQKCIPMEKNDCYKHVFSELKFSDEIKTAVDSCVENSFTQPGNYESSNIYLQTEKEAWGAFDTHKTPLILIDHVRYNPVVLDPENFFKEICSKFTNPPHACVEIPNSTPAGPSAQKLLIIIGVLVLCLILVIYYYKVMSRREMTRELNLKMNEMVSSYFSIAEGKSNEGTQ